MSNLRTTLLLPFAVMVILSACSGSGATTPPSSPPPAPSASPSGPALPITTPEAAMAAIVAVEPRFAGIRAQDPDVIGQSAWYEAKPASGVGAFVVTIQVGWGDCPAGCIERHEWTYAVAPDGGVTLMSESGSEVPGDVWPNPGGPVTTGVKGVATAGPVCPVEQPNDPACAPRPVAGAVVVAQDATGAEVAFTRTAADGSFSLPLAPGEYVIVGRPAEGLMSAPEPVPVTVRDGALTEVPLAYDTGIR